MTQTKSKIEEAVANIKNSSRHSADLNALFPGHRVTLLPEQRCTTTKHLEVRCKSDTITLHVHEDLRPRLELWMKTHTELNIGGVTTTNVDVAFFLLQAQFIAFYLPGGACTQVTLAQMGLQPTPQAPMEFLRQFTMFTQDWKLQEEIFHLEFKRFRLGKDRVSITLRKSGQALTFQQTHLTHLSRPIYATCQRKSLHGHLPRYHYLTFKEEGWVVSSFHTMTQESIASTDHLLTRSRALVLSPDVELTSPTWGWTTHSTLKRKREEEDELSVVVMDADKRLQLAREEGRIISVD